MLAFRLSLFSYYFQRYALHKLFIAKIKKGSRSINTGDRVMVLCNSLHGPLSVYHYMLTLPYQSLPMTPLNSSPNKQIIVEPILYNQEGLRKKIRLK